MGRVRTIWSLSNAFASSFKELDPIPQFKATAKLGEFLETQFSPSFQLKVVVSADRLFPNAITEARGAWLGQSWEVEFWGYQASSRRPHGRNASKARLRFPYRR